MDQDSVNEKSKSNSGKVVAWIISLSLSLFALFVIGYKWDNVQRTHAAHTIFVKNSAQLEQVIANGDTIEFKAGNDPFLIPTGLFVQSLAFGTPSDVNITGYIWQKYPENFPKNFKKGIIFPEEVNSSDTTLREIYRCAGEENGKRYETIGWYFDVTVRQSFDYSFYPLNYLTVWLRLWSADFLNADRILIVPDFKAYAIPIGSTFGLDREIVHGEWEVDEVSFSYNNIPYDTDFGFFSEVKHQTYKELFFNVGIQRKFLNAFVVNLVPLWVVALLLFSRVITVSGEEGRASRFGLTQTV
ncbi:MAG: hypothetical protein OEM02_03710 [Desulfobulbaceae bacterium]|nr:hypothetical protein [Desulfobulbaceae bacterium]